MAVGLDTLLAYIQALADKIDVIQVDQPSPRSVALGRKTGRAIPLRLFPVGDGVGFCDSVQRTLAVDLPILLLFTASTEAIANQFPGG